MRYHIEVTQEDIDAGAPRDPCFCPVARAVKRATDSDFVSVESKGVFVRLYADLAHAYFDLPQIARNFIQDFDCDYCDYPVAPISFDLDEGR